MKIGFISDLHMDYNYHHDFRTALTKVCNNLKLNYLIFAGDITTSPYSALGFYMGLQDKVNTKILQIPGNHEKYYYFDNEELSVDIKTESYKDFYDLLLNKQFSLYMNPLEVNNWVIIGDTGWYDYSFHPKYPKINIKDVHRKRKMFFAWADCKYIDGHNSDIYSDINATNASLLFLEQKLEQIVKLYPNRKICVVTHVVPNKKLIKYSIFPPINYFMSFLGSESYSELYKKYKVKLSIFGHSHYRIDKVIDNINYINVALGYNYEWKNKLDVYQEILKAMYILEC